MFSFKKTENPVKERQFEQMQATIANQAALIDYIAIMSDIEIPEDEEGGSENE